MAKQVHLLVEIYHTLWDWYGPQGWWPLQHLPHHYHPQQYDFPKTREEIFEIIYGAVLTQNTSWHQVEIALSQLDPLTKGFQPEILLELPSSVLKNAIRPAGYFNQKSEYLRNICQFILQLNGGIPSRSSLLSVKGIGPETADSILLYAFGQPEFVVDAYTRRIFTHLQLIPSAWKYPMIKKFFEDSVPQEVQVYQEYHALIVAHAKQYYSKNAHSNEDPLMKLIKHESP
jgi:endonuclease III related protein